MDESKEERIRQRAYELWYGQGRPQGRDREHWEQACREIEGESAQADGVPTPAEAATAAADADLPRGIGQSGQRAA